MEQYVLEQSLSTKMLLRIPAIQMQEGVRRQFRVQVSDNGKIFHM